MRWDQLFADLESRFEQLADDQAVAELADRERVEQGAVSMGARLSGALGATVRLRLTHGVPVAGSLRTVGPDWVLIGESPGREALVRLAAVTVVEGLTTSTGRPVAGVGLRLDLRRALRGVARDRSPVSITVPGATGGGLDGSHAVELTGTIDRIGADFVETALHAPWEPRRAMAVRQVVLVPLTAIVVVRPMALG